MREPNLHDVQNFSSCYVIFYYSNIKHASKVFDDVIQRFKFINFKNVNIILNLVQFVDPTA